MHGYHKWGVFMIHRHPLHAISYPCIKLYCFALIFQSPPWAYVLCAVGFFIYQSLDAIDGKQARRTNTSTPLGEFFDHGCDAVSIFFVSVAAMCATGMHDHPYAILFFILLILELTFVYHWQTYVCGTLHFKM